MIKLSSMVGVAQLVRASGCGPWGCRFESGHLPFRRGSVIILVIAILVLIFLIGVTSLFVARSHRESAEQSIKAKQLRDAQEAMTTNVMLQLRADVVGDNGVVYDGR